LAHDLPELLTIGRTRTPTICILLLVFIAEHLLKRTALVVQVDEQGSAQALGWRGGQEDLVDICASQLANRHLYWASWGGMARDDHPTPQRQMGQWLQPIGDGADIEDLLLHVRLVVPHHHVTGLLQACLDLGVVEQLVVATASEKSQPSVLSAREGRGGPVQPIEAQQGVGGAQPFGLQIGDDDMAGGHQFGTIIAIASTREGAEPLLSVGLEDGGPGSYDLAAFAAALAWRTDRCHAPTRGGEVLVQRQWPLPRHLPGGVDIKEQQLVAVAIEQTAEGVRGEAVQANSVFEQLTQGVEAGRINVGQKAAEGRAVPSALASEEGHEGSGKGCQTLEKRLQGGLATGGIAKQNGHKVDDVVVTCASTGQPYLGGDGLERPRWAK
jgi:hypothetical protein